MLSALLQTLDLEKLYLSFGKKGEAIKLRQSLSVPEPELIGLPVSKENRPGLFKTGTDHTWESILIIHPLRTSGDGRLVRSGAAGQHWL